MGNLRVMNSAVASQKAWRRRKLDQHVEPNADEEWGRLRRLYPQLSDEEAEEVFQNTVLHPRRGRPHTT